MDKDRDKVMDKDMDRIERQIIETLHKEDSNCIFFHGDIGTGKTTFIKNLLAQNNFLYRDFDICNKHTITEFIEEMNTISHNIMDMFAKSIRKKVVVIDNIDILYEIDKTIITNLIKIVRPKKTKRQKEECYSIYPIICISNTVDKKLVDLVKICKVIEFPSSHGDLRLHNYRKWSDNENITTKINREEKLYTQTLSKKFEYLDRNDVKVITNRLIYIPFKFNEDILYINDNDKTTISLLYHENIVDYLPVSLGEKNSIIEQGLVFFGGGKTDGSVVDVHDVVLGCVKGALVMRNCQMCTQHAIRMPGVHSLQQRNWSTNSRLNINEQT